MKQKWRHRNISRCIISFVLTLAMVLGLIPGMSMTVKADGEKAYAAYDVTTAANKDKSGDELVKLLVNFNGMPWYIIEDNSTAPDAGTVTLLAKDAVEACTFDYVEYNEDNEEPSNHYSASDVKNYLDGLTTGDGSFAGVADAIVTATVTVTVNYYDITEIYDTAENVKLYLLSTEEAETLPVNIRKCSSPDTAYSNCWWLRSPGSDDHKAACVDGDSGRIFTGYTENNVNEYPYGVRPALKLDLSAVSFDPDLRDFKTSPQITEVPEALSHIYNGNKQELVTAGAATYGDFYYAVGDSAETAPEFDGLSDNDDKKWSTAIPEASALGSYYVWYMVKGDASHFDSVSVCVTAEIKAKPLPEYTVSFDMGGHGEAIPPQKVISGNKVQKPEDPTDADYDFIGWNTDKECKQEYDFSQKVTESFTIYAKWTKKADPEPQLQPVNPEKPETPDTPDTPVQPETPKPDTEIPLTPSVNKSTKINDADVSVSINITYPKAVNWTGSKITVAQLAVLAQNGEIAKVKIEGLENAIAALNKDADLSKLIKISYIINKKKKVGEKGSFYVKFALNSKVCKKAKIKGADKKALEKLIKDINTEFKAKPYEFDIAPVDLSDAKTVESVSLKAAFKNGELQLNEDGSIKKLKSLKIKVKIPGKKKAKTYSFSGKKIEKSFSIKLTDPATKKAEITALEGQNFKGSRSGVEIVK